MNKLLFYCWVSSWAILLLRTRIPIERPRKNFIRLLGSDYFTLLGKGKSSKRKATTTDEENVAPTEEGKKASEKKVKKPRKKKVKSIFFLVISAPYNLLLNQKRKQ